MSKKVSQTITMNDVLGTQPPEMQEWLVQLDSFLLNNGCKVAGDSKDSSLGGRFKYTSKKSKKAVCTLTVHVSGNTVKLPGNHLADADNVLASLSSTQLAAVTRGPGCEVCGASKVKSADGECHCRHG